MALGTLRGKSAMVPGMSSAEWVRALAQRINLRLKKKRESQNPLQRRQNTKPAASSQRFEEIFAPSR
jgi:hypothetical protein